MVMVKLAVGQRVSFTRNRDTYGVILEISGSGKSALVKWDDNYHDDDPRGTWVGLYELEVVN